MGSMELRTTWSVLHRWLSWVLRSWLSLVLRTQLWWVLRSWLSLVLRTTSVVRRYIALVVVCTMG